MKIDLNELEALARAATPGPWELNRHGAVIGGPVQQYANGKGQNQLAMATGADWMRLDEMACNAAHIAAANPSAVLELIALARQAGGAGMAAIPLVTSAELSAVISWLDNGCDPKEAAKELRSYRERAAAPVAQQGGGELPQDGDDFLLECADRLAESGHYAWAVGMRQVIAQRAASVPAQAGQQPMIWLAQWYGDKECTDRRYWACSTQEEAQHYVELNTNRGYFNVTCTQMVAAPVPAASVQGTVPASRNRGHSNRRFEADPMHNETLLPPGTTEVHDE